MEVVVYQETIKSIFQIDTNHFFCVSRSKAKIKSLEKALICKVQIRYELYVFWQWFWFCIELHSSILLIWKYWYIALCYFKGIFNESKDTRKENICENRSKQFFDDQGR